MALPALLTALPTGGGMRLDVSSISNSCGFATNSWHAAKITVSDLTGTGATLVAEGTRDGGVSWSAALALSDVNNGGKVAVIPGDGDFGIVCAGYKHVRVRPSTAGAGIALVGATGVSVDASLVALLGTISSPGAPTHAAAYYQVTVTSAAKTFADLIGAAVPAWATSALVTVEGDVNANGGAYLIRYRADGTAPTASLGQALRLEDPVLIEGAATLAAAQFISAGPSSLTSIEFRG